jgi:hypothetical protein
MFADGADLHARLLHYVEHPEAADAMASRGRQYVLDNYTWPVVLDRMEADLERVILARDP